MELVPLNVWRVSRESQIFMLSSQLTLFFLFNSRPQPIEWCWKHLQIDFSPLFTWSLLGCVQSFVFKVNLDPLKLTRNKNHHRHSKTKSKFWGSSNLDQGSVTKSRKYMRILYWLFHQLIVLPSVLLCYPLHDAKDSKYFCIFNRKFFYIIYLSLFIFVLF